MERLPAVLALSELARIQLADGMDYRPIRKAMGVSAFGINAYTANQGELAPTGGLGVDAAGDAGLDIVSDLRAGRTRTNTGYATLNVDGRQRFYQISLLTGRADQIGTFSGKAPVTDIAVMLDR